MLEKYKHVLNFFNVFEVTDFKSELKI